MKKIIILIIFTLAFTANIYCQATTDSSKIPQDIRNKSTVFFEYLMADTVSFAFSKLLQGSPIAERSTQLDNLIEQTRKSFDVYGMINGYEFVNAEIVGKSLIRTRYISLHKNYPLRWIFTFYKTPNSSWIIINIKFDDLTEYFFKDE